MLRLAAWSGPRNVSTALMRSFGSRDDCVVCDEPLYAHYLQQTGLPHPGADEVIAQHETDWREVANWLTGPLPDSPAVFYQKHMAHHLLPGIERGWLDSLEHVFLIREPGAMLTSLLAVTPQAELPDTGLPQQVELFERVCQDRGSAPPVIDSRDLLEAPEAMLRALCEAVGIPFDPAMLRWERGPRPTDGCWAPHWYASVEASTGFHPYRPKTEQVPEAKRELLDRSMALYTRLHAHRLLPRG